MTEAEDDLRATTDSIAADLERLHGIEDRKRGMDPADPEARSLSGEAETVAARVLHETTAERELVEEAASDD